MTPKEELIELFKKFMEEPAYDMPVYYPKDLRKRLFR